MKDRLPYLNEEINEEKLVVPGKGEFVVMTTAEDNYVKLHFIPNSQMLDSIGDNKEQFKQDAVKFLTNKFGVEFTEEYGHHAGYMFKFRVSELIKDLNDIIK
jgi:hypothetical protein